MTLPFVIALIVLSALVGICLGTLLILSIF